MIQSEKTVPGMFHRLIPAMLGLVALSLLSVSPVLAQPQTTLNLPGFSQPVLAPASQAPFFQNVIPNALASYFTYTPYTNAAAVAAGFPAGVCGVTEDCYTVSARKFPQQLALPSVFGGGEGLKDGNGVYFGLATQVWG